MAHFGLLAGSQGWFVIPTTLVGKDGRFSYTTCTKLLTAQEVPLGLRPGLSSRAPSGLGVSVACLLVAVLLAATGRTMAQMAGGAREITRDDVRKAIEGGTKFLKQQQKSNGSWPEWTLTHQPTGVTSLCTLALLECGVGVEDESVRQALEYLRRQRPDKIRATYSVALQTMVFCRARQPGDVPAIERNVEWLERKQLHGGAVAGAWSYPEGTGDNSNSQFALLALYEAERAGVPVKRPVWEAARRYWEDCQNPDGSFGYHKGFPGTGSMTCAGITSLVITNDMIQPPDVEVTGPQINGCGVRRADNSPVQRALQWLGGEFSVDHNPSGDFITREAWLFYYLYGVERVGRMTGNRFIGRHDWYREGAEKLVRSWLGKNGVEIATGWKGTGFEEYNEDVTTSLALLFLAKGRRPTLLAKLKHGEEPDWNRHRSDVNNLTRYVESRWRLDLTWQNIDLRTATIDDLVQSPVLYLSGEDDPAAGADRDEVAKNLRGYVERGGFLFAEADCSGAGFHRGFQELMRRAFPEPEYVLTLLPREHPVWHAEEAVPPELQRPLWGIEFGCRTSVVYVPPKAGRPSLSCLWELARSGRERHFDSSVEKQIKAGLAIGINVLAYATNRQLRPKEDAFVREEAPAADGFSRGQILRGQPAASGRVQRGAAGPAQPAGRGRPRAEAPHQRRGARDQHHRFVALPLPLGLHARPQRIRAHARRAETVEDLPGAGRHDPGRLDFASPAFTESFHREMALVLPGKPLKPVPANDRMLTRAYGGFDLSSVTQRVPQPEGSNGPLKDVLQQGPPVLEAIKLDDRYAVVFSPYDLSCALEKQNSPECRGYSRDDAARIGMNVILYSLQQ